MEYPDKIKNASSGRKLKWLLVDWKDSPFKFEAEMYEKIHTQIVGYYKIASVQTLARRMFAGKTTFSEFFEFAIRAAVEKTIAARPDKDNVEFLLEFDRLMGMLRSSRLGGLNDLMGQLLFSSELYFFTTFYEQEQQIDDGPIKDSSKHQMLDLFCAAILDRLLLPRSPIDKYRTVKFTLCSNQHTHLVAALTKRLVVRYCNFIANNLAWKLIGPEEERQPRKFTLHTMLDYTNFCTTYVEDFRPQLEIYISECHEKLSSVYFVDGGPAGYWPSVLLANHGEGSSSNKYTGCILTSENEDKLSWISANGAEAMKFYRIDHEPVSQTFRSLTETDWISDTVHDIIFELTLHVESLLFADWDHKSDHEKLYYVLQWIWRFIEPETWAAPYGMEVIELYKNSFRE